MNVPESLGDFRSDFTLDESFGMLQRAFDVYRDTTSPPLEARNAWLRDTHCDDIFVGVIIEHSKAIQGTAPQSWILSGLNIDPREKPEIETISELASVKDLTQLLDQYTSSESIKVRALISELAYSTLSKALSAKFITSGWLVWGITDKRTRSRAELGIVNAQELARQAYELTDE